MARNTSFTYYILYICIGFLYPAYCSLIALQTPDKKDDTMWLIYWVVFALLNVAEVATDFVLFWFPLYPMWKLLVLIWCSLYHQGWSGHHSVIQQLDENRVFLKPNINSLVVFHLSYSNTFQTSSEVKKKQSDRDPCPSQEFPPLHYTDVSVGCSQSTVGLSLHLGELCLGRTLLEKTKDSSQRL
ncbi:receptor expression-enhancing protein [Trichonephila clavata]|uniref:Receptor expression-enhancing protein n=1 Tax=Trichonephila clavata TaxID=2740835 RepID=A0A8X6L624_TRICU|nr:receptor expression-enhancing protein [Trichonephila clavata]